MKSALIVTAKDVSTAPRVLREIDVLVSSGWSVDTIGFGEAPSKSNKHFELRRLGTAARFLGYLIRHNRWRFEVTLGRRFARLSNLRLDLYSLVIIHEPNPLPWRIFRDTSAFLTNCRFHLDLHENHLNSLSRTPLEELVFGRYRKWELTVLDEFIESMSSRVTLTSCSESISKLYGERWNLPVLTVRNAPPLVDLKPSKISEKIKLVHHGVGTRDRFHREYIEALADMEPKFELHFYLLASHHYLRSLRKLARRQGVGARVFFHDVVPTQEIAQTINRFDIGLVVIPPVTRNEMLALPNKLYESSQARLALVTGPNPDMAKTVALYGNGVILADWTKHALISALKDLSPQSLLSLKQKSDQHAVAMSDEIDKKELTKLLNNN